MRAKRAHEKRLKRFSRVGWRRSPFSVHGLAEQVGHSLVGKRPTGAFSDSTRFPLEGERKQGMDNLRFSTPCNPVFPFRQICILTADRVGKYELRTAGACRPAHPVVLGLRCERKVYGTTANQVQVLYSSGARCGSTTCFCGADLRAWSCTSLLFEKKFVHPFLSDRILYYSRLSVCLHVCEPLPICPVYWAARLSPSIRPAANLSRNSGIFGTKITQSKVKPLASESGNFFPRQNCGFSKIALDKLPVT